MGLYSTNRIGAFSESAQQIADIVKEIEETAYDPNFGSLLEIPIMLQENDQRMFESLIEADFISVTNEAVMLEAEAEKANGEANKTKVQAIKEKISQIIETVISAIKKAVANFIAKVMSVIKNDKKLIDSYASVLNEKNLEGFAGIKDFAFPKDFSDSSVKNLTVSYLNDLADATKFINSDPTLDEMESFYKDLVEKHKNEDKKDIDNMFFNEKTAAFVPNNSQISLMKTKLTNANDTLKNVKDQASRIIAILKDTKTKTAKIKTDAKKDKNVDEETVKFAKASYDIVSYICNSGSKYISKLVNGVSRQIGAYRKCWILCGRYAAKKAKGEESETKATAESVALEEAMQIALAESSDIYVFERLGYGIY